MKSSAIKILQSYLNKKNVNNLKKKISKKNVLISFIIVIFISLFSFFARPYFYDYSSNKEIIQSKVNNYLNADLNINGDISFNFLPTPRLVLKKIEIKLGNDSNQRITLTESNLILSPLSVQSIENLKFKKLYIKNQKIELFPENIKKYLIFFQNHDSRKIVLKNCDIFFQDKQSNIISLNNFNLKNQSSNKKTKTDIKSLFSNH